MNSKILCVGVIVICLNLQLYSSAQAQRSGTSDREKEERGEVEFTNFALEWPSISSHPRAFLAINGKGKTWTQLSTDGEKPSFSAIEEGLTAGVYTYRIKYSTGEAEDKKQSSRNAFAERRSLLKKRLELFEAGDRAGAKAALNQANQIRKDESERSSFAGTVKAFMSRVRQTDSDTIARTGRFTVHSDGKVEAFETDAEDEAKAESQGSGREEAQDQEK